jgi:hypothetical protein
MTGDCHVRFCERLRGETPLCLLGEKRKKNRLPRRTFKNNNSRKACLPQACRRQVGQLIYLRVFSAVICVNYFFVLDLR